MTSPVQYEPKLSVIVPAFNEQATVARVIEKLLHVPSLQEIVVVDDASSDRTFSVVQELQENIPQLRLLRHPVNMGKTAALRTGFAVSVGEVVIVQDADLEYDPAEIQDVIQPILDGVADVVYGSRFLVRKAARIRYFHYYLANKALTFLSNLLTSVNFSDIETGSKAFRGDIIRDMIITSSGFGFEIEATAKACKLGCICFEVPISYYGRTYHQGKKIRVRDGIAAFWYTVQYNLFTSLADSFRTLQSRSSLEQLRRAWMGDRTV
jgi:glycosyltransferase involved in cell wall biosynthesis